MTPPSHSVNVRQSERLAMQTPNGVNILAHLGNQKEGVG